MVVVDEQREPPAEVAVEPAPPVRARVRRSRTDLWFALVCVAGAFYLTIESWLDPNHRVIRHNMGDQALFEWLLTYQAHAVAHLDNPLWTKLLNAPIGVNLAVNTSMVAVGTVVAPITLLLGAPVAFLMVLTANLAVTPYVWYHVLSRHVTRTRSAAMLGALFCGFAPGIVSHANGHLNFTAQYLVPVIALYVAKLREPGRAVRNGVILGLLVTVDYLIGAEMLLFVAGACAAFLLFWVPMNRTDARRSAPQFGRGLVVAGGVSLVLLLYPLWLQFRGPQRYHGIGFDQKVHAEDFTAYGSFPYLSLARLAGLWKHHIAANYTEETSFFGPVLLILAIYCVVRMWHRLEVRALALTGLVFAILALGPKLRFHGKLTSFWMPFALLWKLPIFNTALPARLALITIPVVGVLLALALERSRELPLRARRGWLAAFVVALLPLFPLPVPAAPRAAVPKFFTDGTWRQYVHPGQTLIPVPPASDYLPDGQRWQTATDFGFAIPSGFFLGPGGPDNRSRIGPVPRPSAALLTGVAMTGTVPPVTAKDRARAKADLVYWHGTVIVLSDGGPGSKWTPYQAKLLSVATALYGTPRRVDDVWLWPVPTA